MKIHLLVFKQPISIEPLKYFIQNMSTKVLLKQR